MASLANIRAGFAAVLSAAYPEAQVTGYLLPSPSAPAFEVEPGEDGVTYDLSMKRGADDWMFTVRGIRSTSLDVAAQKQLDVWLASTGSGSVKTVLEAAPTLPVGGSATVSHLRVVRASGPRRFVIGDIEYLGAEWSVRVIAA